MKELYDLTVGELLDEYCLLENLECGYYYGLVRLDFLDEVYEEYNIREEYPEAFDPQSIIPDEILVMEDSIISYDKLIRILRELGISKKEDL